MLSIVQKRLLHTNGPLRAAAATRKSFNKSNTYDKSKNKKGSGNDKSWKDSILTKNYQRKAQDKDLIEQLNTFNPLKALEITKYDNEINKKLHISGTFNPHQYNELYSQPLTMVRPREDKFMNEFFSRSLASESKANRLIITGDRGVGKSTVLTHFQSQVLASDASILLPVSFADALVDGSNDFKLNPSTKLYDQPMYSSSLLKKLANLNKELFQKINLSKDTYKLLNNNYKASQVTLTNTNTLFDLCSLKSNTDVNSTQLFQLLLNELEALPDTFNVYLTIDNFSAFLQHGMTKYRDTSNKQIYFQKFSIIDSLLAFVAGERSFQKGAVVVANHGNHKCKSNKTFDVVLGKVDQEDLAYAKLSKFDPQFANRLLQNGGLQNLNVSKFDLSETETIVKHLWNFNLIHNEFNSDVELNNFGNQYFSKLAQRKFVISGNGNGKLLLDSCILSYA